MFAKLLTLTVLITTPTLVGCGPSVRMPNFWDPGNAASQQHSAIYHDPYPLDDVGPAVVGGRPRGYQVSVPPVVRGRLLTPQSQRVAPPG